MVNITEKSNTLRIAIAEATVNVTSQDTIDAILNRTVPRRCLKCQKQRGY